MSALRHLEHQRHLAEERLDALTLRIAAERARLKLRQDNRKKELSRIAQARKMREKGFTHAQIASVMGYSRSRAQYITKGIK